MKNARRNPIRLYVTDLDGCLTNNVITFDHQGNVSKGYHTHDCSGLWKLQNEANIPVLILTGSKYACDIYRFAYLMYDKVAKKPVDVEALVANMPITTEHMIQGAPYVAKSDILDEYLTARKIAWDEVAFMGDAENDYGCLQKVGWPGCPADAIPSVRELCEEGGYVCQHKGGEGAAYEFASLVIKTQEFFADNKATECKRRTKTSRARKDSTGLDDS